METKEHSNPYSENKNKGEKNETQSLNTVCWYWIVSKGSVKTDNRWKIIRNIANTKGMTYIWERAYGEEREKERNSGKVFIIVYNIFLSIIEANVLKQDKWRTYNYIEPTQRDNIKIIVNYLILNNVSTRIWKNIYIYLYSFLLKKRSNLLLIINGFRKFLLWSLSY